MKEGNNSIHNSNKKKIPTNKFNRRNARFAHQKFQNILREIKEDRSCILTLFSAMFYIS